MISSQNISSVTNDPRGSLPAAVGTFFLETDHDFDSEEDYHKFTVIVDEYELIFYKNKITSRWWIEIFGEGSNTKLKQHTLLPCTEDDYKTAKNGIIPDRWFKAIKKNIL